jgi:hypothetical protein
MLAEVALSVNNFRDPDLHGSEIIGLMPKRKENV